MNKSVPNTYHGFWGVSWGMNVSFFCVFEWLTYCMLHLNTTACISLVFLGQNRTSLPLILHFSIPKWPACITFCIYFLWDCGMIILSLFKVYFTYIFSIVPVLPHQCGNIFSISWPALFCHSECVLSFHVSLHILSILSALTVTYFVMRWICTSTFSSNLSQESESSFMMLRNTLDRVSAINISLPMLWITFS